MNQWITLWKNLLTKNSPGSRYQILLSTFRFIITFFKTNLIYTEQSITLSLTVKLKRKKKAHQGNHFSPTIHNYIVSFSVKKTGAHLGVVCCPFLHFHQLASARLEPHVRSAGPTTGNHKGRVNIGDLHFAPGWVTGLSQPPSMRFFNRLTPKRRKWRSFLSCILQFQLLNQWFFLLCQCHLCPGPSGRATHWIKLG